jgi:HTH-type transcriptional regulator / antitoxin HigA
LVEALDAALDAGGAEVLRFLMARDNLRQVDLSELGSQGVVSELLSGKREFNMKRS